MPESAMWTMIVSLVILCFGITLRLTKAEHALKLMDEEFKRFFSKINSFKDTTNKTVLGIKESHDRSVKEVVQRYAQEIEKLRENIEHLEKSPRIGIPYLLVKRPKKN